MLACAIRSRRTENNRQNIAVHVSAASAMARCLTILRCQYDKPDLADMRKLLIRRFYYFTQGHFRVSGMPQSLRFPFAFPGLSERYRDLWFICTACDISRPEVCLPL
jgi:hypothetical protein